MPTSKFTTLLALALPLITSAQTLPQLQVAPDQRHLQTADGQPFLWIGDTAWELFHRLDTAEADHYLRTRAAQGVNVVQAVALAELDGLRTPNPYGALPLVDEDPTRLGETYFQHVDWIIRRAAELGIYTALLPTWGDKFNIADWGTGPEVFTPTNAQAFAKTLGTRYAKHPHIIWVLGGDRWPADQEDRDIVDATAAGLRDGGASQLITYHPNGARRATEYFDAAWLDFDMFQTGHDRRQLDFAYVRASLAVPTRRPTVNAEPRYEDHPDRFDQARYFWMDQSDVRQSAYWTFFSGGAGYTYGCHDVWQMWSPPREPINGARTHWREALALPGARQLPFLRKLLTATAWHTWQPRQDLVVYDSTEVDLVRTEATPALAPDARGIVADSMTTLAVVARGGELLLVYTPFGKTITLDAARLPAALKPKTVSSWWYNPRDGSLYAAKPVAAVAAAVTSPPASPAARSALRFEPTSKGWGSDFILVLASPAAASFVGDLDRDGG